ncbi:MAG: hypothetical protein KH828_12510 [Clostridiales bacterium]|nr:hypothetical protein [Clostridiales bacterium]
MEGDDEVLRGWNPVRQGEMQAIKACISGALRRENLSDFLVELPRCPDWLPSPLLEPHIPRSSFPTPIPVLSFCGPHILNKPLNSPIQYIIIKPIESKSNKKA